MLPAGDHRLHARPALDPERAGPLRAVELVRRQRQQVHAQGARVHGNLARRLYRVGVQQRAAGVRDGCQFGDRLDRADLVVRVHHRHERGVVGERLAEAIGRHDSALVHSQQLMLDPARDEMPASGRLERIGRATKREVVRLGAPAREHDLRRVAVQQRRHRRSCVVHHRLCLLAEVMHARRVAENVAGGARHRVDHFLREGCRRVVVKVDTHSESFIVSLPLTLGNKRTRQAFARPIYSRELRLSTAPADILAPW